MDRQLVLNKIESLRRCVRRVEARCPDTVAALREDWDTHWYFWENAVERHGVTLEEVEAALDNIVEEHIQKEGRRRVWGWVEDRKKYFRVIFLPDGRLFNAFPDSPYTTKRGAPP